MRWNLNLNGVDLKVDRSSEPSHITICLVPSIDIGTQLSAERLDLLLLLVFNTFVKESTMSRAGERLFITQPAESAHIKAVEQDLGVRLFERVGRRPVVNLAGLVLYEKAQLLLAVADDLKAAMSEL